MNNKTVALSCFFGAIIAATILAKPWVTIHHTKPIVVKGYAEMAVVSDRTSRLQIPTDSRWHRRNRLRDR